MVGWDWLWWVGHRNYILNDHLGRQGQSNSSSSSEPHREKKHHHWTPATSLLRAPLKCCSCNAQTWSNVFRNIMMMWWKKPQQLVVHLVVEVKKRCGQLPMLNQPDKLENPGLRIREDWESKSKSKWTFSHISTSPSLSSVQLSLLTYLHLPASAADIMEESSVLRVLFSWGQLGKKLVENL